MSDRGMYTQINLDNIINMSPVGKGAINSGQVVRFNYGGNVRDPQPLVLCVVPNYNGLLYGVNLNYISEPEQKRFFPAIGISSRGTTKQLVELYKKSKPLFRFRTSPSKSYYDGTLKRALKQTIGNAHFAYRSYKIGNISSPQLVDWYSGLSYEDGIREEVENKIGEDMV
tara:strand:+ start:87 stop:596 length:510 start_codon:yes stop_codon:yes gene_type:complete